MATLRVVNTDLPLEDILDGVTKVAGAKTTTWTTENMTRVLGRKNLYSKNRLFLQFVANLVARAPEPEFPRETYYEVAVFVQVGGEWCLVEGTSFIVPNLEAENLVARRMAMFIENCDVVVTGPTEERTA
jgi:hypothetical protein